MSLLISLEASYVEYLDSVAVSGVAILAMVGCNIINGKYDPLEEENSFFVIGRIVITIPDYCA